MTAFEKGNSFEQIAPPVLLQPDNHNKKYEQLFVQIDTGQVKLPMFQRDFVWDKEQSAKLNVLVQKRASQSPKRL